MATAQAPSRPAATRTTRPPDGFRRVTTVVSLAAPVVLIAIVIVVVITALPAIRRFGPGFLISTQWDPVRNAFGALPMIIGTIVTSFIGLALALPIGIAVAVFLAEPGASGVRGAIGIGVELLAAIPSVVYGIWGLYVLAPWLLTHFSRPVSERLSGVPVLAGPARQTSLLIAGVVLAIMVLPTLSSISREVIRAIPNGLREASVALGSTWSETIWRVVLPAARTGIFGATVLALGRALGETIAVTMTVGNYHPLPTSLFGPGYTLASAIANEFTEATGTLYPAALIELALVLMLVTLTVNILALLLVRRVSQEARV